MSPENSPDHPLGSVAPEAPVAENPWAAGPIETGEGDAVASNGVHNEVVVEAAPTETVPAETVPVETVPAETLPISPEAREFPRSTLSEWVITILLLLFLTTFLVQAFVIPTGSMEDTLLIGDHLLVDKLAYAPPGPVSKYILPYTEVKRGDIIVFRYPVDIQQTFVKRCMGVPGDRIRIVNKQVYLNGVKLDEPYKVQ